MESSKPSSRRTGTRGHKRDFSEVIALQQRIAAGELGTPASLNAILEEIARIAKASGAMLEAAGAGGWSMQGVAGCFAPFSTGLPAAPALGLKVRTELSICDDTLASADSDREACGSVGARSIAAVPLMRDGAAALVLTLVSDGPAAFASSDRDRLRLLAGLAMTAALSPERAP